MIMLLLLQVIKNKQRPSLSAIIYQKIDLRKDIYVVKKELTDLDCI